MKLPVSMLRDFVETPLSAEGLADLLTMAGFEVEDVVEVEGESVLDVTVMANRGDGLSALGLAREVLAKDEAAKPTALYERARARFALPDDGRAPDGGWGASVTIETDRCSRYACRLFDGLANLDAPDWMQRRLRQAGMRPLGLVVDVTNYVLLEVGQPLHAFDFDKLEGGAIVVRQASADGRIVTLNGEDHALTADDMMICDATRPVAVAGVMGGLDTEVTGQTRRMLLESAHFENFSVRRTRKRLGLSTEASYRFERWVDPDGVGAALNRFRELYAEVAGDAGCLPGLIDRYPLPFRPASVRLRVDRCDRLLGMDVPAPQVRQYLQALGFAVDGEASPFQVTPPTWRPDVVREDDLIEEVGRVHGYDRIPEVLLQGTTPLGGAFGIYGLTDRVRDAVLRCGFHQTISHSLRDAGPLDFPLNELVAVRNPHSPEMGMLRNSLLPCLADNARRNGGRNVHLFEIGRVFVKGDHQIGESPELGLLSCGALDAPSREKCSPEASFFTLKGVLAEVGAAVGAGLEFEPPTAPDRRLHPTRQASVLAADEPVLLGVLGQIHPGVAEEVDLPAETILAEIDLLALAAHIDAEPHYRPISRNPAVRRDISFEAPKSLDYARIEAVLRAAAGDVLERLWVFDLYAGPGVTEGSHSLSVALQLRKMGENFTDEQANQVRDACVAALGALGAKQR